MTAILPGHTYVSGDLIQINGAVYPEYNGLQIVRTVNGNDVTYSIPEPSVTPDLGLATSTRYNLQAYAPAFYAGPGAVDFVQSSLDGRVYAVEDSSPTDAGTPILFSGRSPKIDGGLSHVKQFTGAVIVGDTEQGILHLRYTNDDYQTWSLYRPIEMAQRYKQMKRLGSGRYRAFEFIYVEPTPLRLESLELTITQGDG